MARKARGLTLRGVLRMGNARRGQRDDRDMPGFRSPKAPIHGRLARRSSAEKQRKF